MVSIIPTVEVLGSNKFGILYNITVTIMVFGCHK